MDIQWFPGHMAKARRKVSEQLKKVDIVFELLDARLPLSSRNPMMGKIIQKKQRLILLTKSDLADPTINQQWVRYFQKQGILALPIDAQSGKGIKAIHAAAEQQLHKLFAKREKKGMASRRFRAMVLGIPNVGKSSLINRLVKRSATQTGNRPGITKAEQWIRINKSMELLDTPGILWPKFDDPEVGLRLAASGAIKEEILPSEEVVLYLIELLEACYSECLKDRYRLDSIQQDAFETFHQIAEKRGCLQKGGVVHQERAAEIILQDFRSGRLGRISLERPEDWNDDNYEQKDHS